MPTHTPAERAKFRRNRDEDELLGGFRQNQPAVAPQNLLDTGVAPAPTTLLGNGVAPVAQPVGFRQPVPAGLVGNTPAPIQVPGSPIGGRTSSDINIIGAPISTTGRVFPSATPTAVPTLQSSRTDPGGARTVVPEGLDRTQTQPATGFRTAVPQGNFIRGAGGTLTEAAGDFNLSGPRFTASVAEELARRGEGAAFIPGEGFRGTGTQPQAATTEGFRQTPTEEADELAAIRAFSTRQDPTQTSLRVSGRLGIGEGGPAQFEGLSPTEIADLQEREALAEGTVGGFRSAQALQGRRLAEREVAATETTAAASLLGVQQRLQATAVKAASDAAKLTGFEFDTVSEERPIDPENPLLGTEKVITGFKGKTKGGALPTLIPLEEMTAFRAALANARTKEDKDRLTGLFTARYLSQPG